MNSQGYADTPRANQERIRTGDCLLLSMILHMLLKRPKIVNNCEMRPSINVEHDLRGRFLRELTWGYSWQRTRALNSCPLNEEAFPSIYTVRFKLKRYRAAWTSYRVRQVQATEHTQKESIGARTIIYLRKEKLWSSTSSTSFVLIICLCFKQECIPWAGHNSNWIGPQCRCPGIESGHRNLSPLWRSSGNLHCLGRCGGKAGRLSVPNCPWSHFHTLRMQKKSKYIPM